MRGVPIALVGLALGSPSAAADEGAVFAPALSTLQPGRASVVTLALNPVVRRDRRIAPMPRDGLRPVVVLRQIGGTRSVRFVAGPLRRGSTWVEITVPSPAHWRVAVRVGGVLYPSSRQPDFVGGADAVPAPVRSAALAEKRVPDTTDGDTPTWPFVGGAAILGALGLGVAGLRGRAAFRDGDHDRAR